MTEIIIIAAVAENGVIGNRQGIPWRIAEDFRRFRRLTLGHPCIMGDATYDSLPEQWRPLPGRENVVLSLDRNYRRPGTTVLHDFDAAIAYVRAQAVPKAFIGGGSTIYRLGLPIADTLELTRLSRPYPGDVYFPPFDLDEWELVNDEPHESLDSVSGESIGYSFSTYRRRRKVR
jgi:dihydrofolate reductase